MAIDSNTLQLVLQLAQSCEDLARAALGVAQNQLTAKTISQADFDQAFGDYGVAMQKARDIYYQASHNLAQQVAAASDLKVLGDQTKALSASLARVQKVDKILTISFDVVAFVATVATAVASPATAALSGAYTAGTALKGAIGI